MQARAYSSKGKDGVESRETFRQDEPTTSTTASRMANAFGFQSLSGLFQQVPSPRYSRPRERNAQRPPVETNTEPKFVDENPLEKPKSDLYPHNSRNESQIGTVLNDNISTTTAPAHQSMLLSSSTNSRSMKEPRKASELRSDSLERAAANQQTTDCHSPKRTAEPMKRKETSPKPTKKMNKVDTMDAQKESKPPQITSSTTESERENQYRSQITNDPELPERPTIHRFSVPEWPWSKTIMYKHLGAEVLRGSMQSSRAAGPRRRANPFDSQDVRSNEGADSAPNLKLQAVAPVDDPKPWGIGPEDQKTVDSILDPESSSLLKQADLTLASDLASSSPLGQVRVTSAKDPAQAAEDRVSKRKAKSIQPKLTQSELPDAPKSNQLTHVNSSGEAHMVDVGTKEHTRRVAVAFAVVEFSNPEPFKLIAENSNKKGDVLGVARVAGIMAAKRTSDLIPLCHPIPISSVKVDVDLGRQSHNFHVAITAQVECTGPTGVEMEALTAAVGAALTVYDMCKAVDREMVIGSNKVVYKSGGKSGLHFDEKWAAVTGMEFFRARGLQVPEAEKKAVSEKKVGIQKEVAPTIRRHTVRPSKPWRGQHTHQNVAATRGGGGDL